MVAMNPRNPLNVKLLEPESYIKLHTCLPVTNHSIYEASTLKFHPDGFFSEVIFGQMGSNERLIKRGYVDLHTSIITPHMFRQLMTMKSLYKKILAGTAYGKFDSKLKDIVPADETDLNAHTGYSWFISVLPKIKFVETDSQKRKDKVKLINKYRDQLLIQKYIILPAGVRDVRNDDGQIKLDKINKLYFELLSLSNALPDTETDNPIFDVIKYKLQLCVQNIYTFIYSFMQGKGGFAQGKFTRRSVVYGSRNVITASTMSFVKSSDDPRAFNVDEVQTPLLQGMKSMVPIMTYQLKTTYMDQIFSTAATKVPLIDPEDFRLTYANVSYNDTKKFTTSAGINGLINDFRNQEIHFAPVSIEGTDDEGNKKDYYLYMVYDNEDEIYFFRDLQTFKDGYFARRHFKVPEKFKEFLELLEPFKDKIILKGGIARCFYFEDEDTSDIDLIPIDATTQKEILALGNSNFDIYKPSEWKDVEGKTIEVDGWKIITPEEQMAELKDSTRLKDKYHYKKVKSIAFDMSRVRPLTWVEMFYTAAYAGSYNRHGVVTRHPMLLIENIVPDRIHIQSTNPSRTVMIRSTVESEESQSIYPDYPVMTAKVKVSCSVHPAHLNKYDGDHDGMSLDMDALINAA